MTINRYCTPAPSSLADFPDCPVISTFCVLRSSDPPSDIPFYSITYPERIRLHHQSCWILLHQQTFPCALHLWTTVLPLHRTQLPRTQIILCPINHTRTEIFLGVPQMFFSSSRSTCIGLHFNYLTSIFQLFSIFIPFTFSCLSNLSQTSNVTVYIRPPRCYLIITRDRTLSFSNQSLSTFDFCGNDFYRALKRFSHRFSLPALGFTKTIWNPLFSRPLLSIHLQFLPRPIFFVHETSPCP